MRRSRSRSACLRLLIAGISLLMRVVHGWRRLLAIPAALVVGYALVLPLCVAVFATNVPRPTLGSRTPG
jgi:hypothetical protein